MALVDKSVILNSNASKRLRITFENLKSDYTDTSAKAYMESYKDQPLSFIIENSRYIFSEPMYGYNFYTESILNNPYAFIFTECENEKEKVTLFLEENGKNMPAKQRSMYDNLLTMVTEKYNETKNTEIILSHGIETDKESYDHIVESVYQMKENPEKINDVISIFENTENPDLFYGCIPYISSLVKENADFNYMVATTINKYFTECKAIDGKIDDTEWKHFIESTIIVSKLFQDKVYVESVGSLRWTNRDIFEGLAVESVKQQIDELFIEHVTENASNNKFNATSFDCFYSTPQNAVNRIFEDDDFYIMMKDDNETFKMERTKLNDIAMNILYEYVQHEYKTCDSVNDIITGYNYFSEGVSIENALLELSNSSFIATEDAGDPSKVVSQHAASYIREKDTKKQEDEQTGDDQKKAIAPKPDSLTQKIQNKAMDLEAKTLKLQAKHQQKGQAVKGMARAVTAIPKNIVDGIKKAGKDWDTADEEKRKAYMIEPGYRKKCIRNLKLAILYGATASTNIALVPVVAIARHFSKSKDRRIRNELARELDTEVKVCEEKISDAAANGDQTEKYKLMRIKSQLERESLRVKSNSKLI